MMCLAVRSPPLVAAVGTRPERQGPMRSGLANAAIQMTGQLLPWRAGIGHEQSFAGNQFLISGAPRNPTSLVILLWAHSGLNRLKSQIPVAHPDQSELQFIE